jgi:hypothetical protein
MKPKSAHYFDELEEEPYDVELAPVAHPTTGVSSSIKQTNQVPKKNPSKKRVSQPRALTYHNQFVSEKMLELNAARPELTGADRFREVAKMWRELSPEEKTALKTAFKSQTSSFGTCEGR